MVNEPNTTWSIQGRCFNPNDPDNPIENQTLSIPETKGCITMRDWGDCFGKPIDANLAVRFINNLFTMYPRVFHPLELSDFDESLKNLKGDNLKDILANINEFHQNLIQLNYGMTLDKNIASKILSQPDCEGLRFYLCAKKDKRVSLVAVGVDSCGYDLNYKASEDVSYKKDDQGRRVLPNQEGMRTIENVEMKSFTVEYVTPPPPPPHPPLDGFYDDIPDEFALLKIAMTPKKI